MEQGLVFIVGGAVVGAVVGLTSTGGGALLTPLLVLMGVPASAAIGSDLVVAIGIKALGGGAYALRREVDWALLRRLALGSVPGTLLGLLILKLLPPGLLEGILRQSLGLVLLLAGGATLARLFFKSAQTPRANPSTWSTALLGAGVGVAVAMTSVGSGSVLLSVLALFYALPSRVMVGTDLVHALLISTIAGAGHFVAGRVDLELVTLLLIGGIPGVLLGARAASFVPERVLRTGLAVLLLGIGLHLALTPRAASAAAPIASDHR